MKKITIFFFCLFLALLCFGITAGAATADKGDTFTLTVKVPERENISSGSIAVFYDHTALELVSGEWLIPDLLISDFKVADGRGVFALAAPTKVGGDILRLTFRIKTGASYTSYDLIANVSITPAGGTTITGATSLGSVSVVCDHSSKYEVPLSPATCTSIGYTAGEYCPDCSRYVSGREEIPCTPHAWDEGTVVTPATCKDVGSILYDCKDCIVTRTEEIDKLTTHTYGGAVKTDDSLHTYTCSVCTALLTEAHEMDEGAVIEPATCAKEGLSRTKCTACDYTVDTAIPKLTEHTWENACDDTCDVCLTTREISHHYVLVWDEQTHKEECTLCKDTRAEEEHLYSEVCDTDCDVCTYDRGTMHRPGERESNETEHWYPCTRCGKPLEIDQHHGSEATCTEDGVCKDCGYVLAPATGHDYEVVVEEPSCTVEGYTSYTCPCGDSKRENPVAALAHKEGEWIVDREAEIGVEGLRHIDCLTCGQLLRSEPISALPEPEPEPEPEPTSGCMGSLRGAVPMLAICLLAAVLPLSRKKED